MQRLPLRSCAVLIQGQITRAAAGTALTADSALIQGSGQTLSCIHAAIAKGYVWRSAETQMRSLLTMSIAASALTTPASIQTNLVRRLTAMTPPLQQQQQQTTKQEQYDSLEITQEKINAITDKIPQRPVGIVEGTSYSVVILAAFGVLAFVLYQFVFNFILEPTALQCFNHTLALLKADPRVTVRLGATDDIRAWGSNSTSRVARQQIPHQIYKDTNGVEHVRIQFYMRGPSGTGLVNADMYKDTAGKWAYTYLLIDVYGSNSNTPSRVYVIKPQ